MVTVVSAAPLVLCIQVTRSFDQLCVWVCVCVIVNDPPQFINYVQNICTVESNRYHSLLKLPAGTYFSGLVHIMCFCSFLLWDHVTDGHPYSFVFLLAHKYSGVIFLPNRNHKVDLCFLNAPSISREPHVLAHTVVYSVLPSYILLFIKFSVA